MQHASMADATHTWTYSHTLGLGQASSRTHRPSAVKCVGDLVPKRRRTALRWHAHDTQSQPHRGATGRQPHRKHRSSAQILRPAAVTHDSTARTAWAASLSSPVVFAATWSTRCLYAAAPSRAGSIPIISILISMLHCINFLHDVHSPFRACRPPLPLTARAATQPCARWPACSRPAAPGSGSFHAPRAGRPSVARSPL